MKKLIFSIVMALGVSAHAETKDYIIQHQCKQGEIAAVLNIEAQNGGAFKIEAACLPAVCHLERTGNALDKPHAYQVFLMPQSTVKERAAGLDRKFKPEVVSEFMANSKQEALVEAKKLVVQGQCTSILYDSSFDY